MEFVDGFLSHFGFRYLPALPATFVFVSDGFMFGYLLKSHTLTAACYKGQIWQAMHFGYFWHVILLNLLDLYKCIETWQLYFYLGGSKRIKGFENNWLFSHSWLWRYVRWRREAEMGWNRMRLKKHTKNVFNVEIHKPSRLFLLLKSFPLPNILLNVVTWRLL